MTTAGSIEREIKLGGHPGFTMPPMVDVLPGVRVIERPALDLDATYFDTSDLRLAREGISLRRRTGDGPMTWTLKLPAGLASSGLRRFEFDVTSEATEVPAELAGLVIGWVRSAPLVAVIDIQTQRQGLLLLDEDGSELIEIDDDQVAVRESGEIVARFREIEVELRDGGSERLLQTVAETIVGAGAGAPDPMPKVVRALGPRALMPSILRTPSLTAEASIAEALAGAVKTVLVELVSVDTAIRLGSDPDTIDRARWSARRIRSVLRDVNLLEGSAAVSNLRRELNWYSKELGALRLNDRLLGRVRSSIEVVEITEGGDVYSLVARARGELASARHSVQSLMSSPRYVALLDLLVELSDPAVLFPKGSQRGREALVELVRPIWKSARSSAKSLPKRPSTSDVRDLRRKVVALCSAVEVAVPLFGARAEEFADLVAEALGCLEAFLDARFLQSWIDERVDRLDESGRVVAAEMVRAQAADAEIALRRWRESWSRCSTRSSMGWCR